MATLASTSAHHVRVASPAAATQVAEFVDVPVLGTVRLGTIGQRFAARLLDVVVVIVGYIILSIAFAVLSAVVAGGTGAASGRSGMGGGIVGAGILGLFAAVFFIGIFAVLYEVVMVALFGRTVGKMLLGLRLVRGSDGRKPNWGNAALRWVAPGLAYLVPVLGGFAAILVLLSPIFDGSGRRQGWHDKLGGTLVVAAR